MAVAAEKTRVVELSGRQFVVNRMPMARVRTLSKTLGLIFKDFDFKQTQANPDEAVEAFVDKLLEAPHAILSLFIRNLPKEIFQDEENGVTFPEFLDALEAAVDLNRLDILKNGFSRLATTALAEMSSQASTSRKRSS